MTTAEKNIKATKSIAVKNVMAIVKLRGRTIFGTRPSLADSDAASVIV